MYFKRKAYDRLKDWKKDPNQKPLIIRGARQVGKTSLVKEFGKEYRYFISLNLEKSNDRKYFNSFDDVKLIIEALMLEQNIEGSLSEILLFIDEIQELPSVIRLLRYFYEDLPDLNVIAAGSLLEFALGDVGSFPVGRVIQFALHPLDFEEFLEATEEHIALKYLQEVPVKKVAYFKLLKLFHRYMIIGGMPEIIKSYIISKRSLLGLAGIYSSIWDNYKDDVIKYADNQTEADIVYHIINTAPNVRDRISFAGFGGSNYKSRRVKAALSSLDRSGLIKLMYPTTNTKLPLHPTLKRKPKIQFLDTGILNYANNIQAQMLQIQDFNALYKGYFVNHMINQEIIAQSHQIGLIPMFWIREKANSNAEVDLVMQHEALVIPVEVKSGAKGRLRSLHEFIDRTNHGYAVRFLANNISIEKSKTRNGKSFQLLNLPYFCATQLEKYLDWWIK